MLIVKLSLDRPWASEKFNKENVLVLHTIVRYLEEKFGKTEFEAQSIYEGSVLIKADVRMTEAIICLQETLKEKLGIEPGSSLVHYTVKTAPSVAAGIPISQVMSKTVPTTPQVTRDPFDLDEEMFEFFGDEDPLPQEQPSAQNVEEPKVEQRLDSVIGAEAFKELMHEFSTISPKLTQRNRDVFYSQCYLFAINDGCGLSTYLKLFGDILSDLDLFKFQLRKVTEIKLQPYKERTNDHPFDKAKDTIQRSLNGLGRIVCIDISEWMTKIREKEFRDFLLYVEDNLGKNLVVFRVPFVEPEVLQTLQEGIGDLLTVRTVPFVPFTNEELITYAREEVKRRGFLPQPEVWDLFAERIAEEKNDGRFYGINTVNKIVRELVYRKELYNACHNSTDMVVRCEELDGFVTAYGDANKTGLELLDEYVGMDSVKQSVLEIVAQIEMSLKSKDLGAPCIHMRFVGNPGTGKTTVARLVGRILKEKGVLRNGGFFEHRGRDLCGVYIGETAPKTAAMCRDAYGSVMFIDEAYSLYRGNETSKRDFGREAIDTLIAEMENHRKDFVVIMAGYPDEMEELMHGNAGLASRMPYVIEFPNYTREQLYEIFLQMAGKNFTFDEEFKQAVKAYFDALPDDVLESKEFSNARFVRNLFERTWAKTVLRAQLNKEDTSVLIAEDFMAASGENEFSKMMDKKRSRALGFV